MAIPFNRALARVRSFIAAYLERRRRRLAREAAVKRMRRNIRKVGR